MAWARRWCSAAATDQRRIRPAPNKKGAGPTIRNSLFENLRLSDPPPARLLTQVLQVRLNGWHQVVEGAAAGVFADRVHLPLAAVAV
jgi:hypothetical protein